jgi:hypothetical protein
MEWGEFHLLAPPPPPLLLAAAVPTKSSNGVSYGFSPMTTTA